MGTNKPNPDLKPANFASLDKNSSPQQIVFRCKLFNFLVAGLIVLFFGTTTFFSYKYYGLKRELDSQQLNLPLPQPTVSSSSPMPSPIIQDDQGQARTPTPSPVRGASLSEIKHTLPDGWEAKIRPDQNDLFLSPKEEGGFLAIKVYTYDEKTGRREYYCQVSRFCINDVTYFTPIRLGNISGYKADTLDNSGGGPEYFGEKGDKFYIISSFSPSYPLNNFFDRTYQQVLDSLVF